jgi:hypothetical protein
MFNLDDLTEEEKLLWDKINSKMEKSIEDIKKENIEKMAKDLEDPNYFNHYKEVRHVTDYQREILIKINAEISTTNDQNKLLEIDNIVENFYHIPVPSGVDYVEKIDEFLDAFDKEIQDCAIKINTKNESE